MYNLLFWRKKTRKKKKRLVSDSGLGGLACDADTDAKLWIAVFRGLRKERPELESLRMECLCLSLFVVISWKCCSFFAFAWFLPSFPYHVAESIYYLWHFLGSFGHNISILTSLCWLIGQILKIVDACLIFSYGVLLSAGLPDFWMVP